MLINFERQVKNLGIRVRAILGVPEEFLSNETISSPDFIKQATKYVNKRISKIEDDIEIDTNLLNIAYIYYICYLLCSGMYARLPKQMENLSTKTILLSIDWDSKALEMLDKCNSIIDDALEEIGEELDYGFTYATLSDESEYPNTNM